MEFKKFWLSIPFKNRQEFAERCGTSANYLALVAFGQKKRVSADMAIRIEHASNGEIVVEQLRPDLPWKIIRNTAPQ